MKNNFNYKISVEDLTKTFQIKTKKTGINSPLKDFFNPEMKEVTAVDNVSFRIEEGESVAFIGPNGAGKSTTIKMLTGILHPSSGIARVNDKIPWKHREKLAYSIGSVFGQKSQLWIHLPPRDSFDLLSDIYEIDKKEYQQHLDRLIDIFQIGEFVDSPVRKLSLGQRMRCEIVASLIHKPQIIFLDEPTIGLDVVAKQNIRKLIRDLNQEENVTVFLTSHDAGDIEEVCKRVIIINNGVIVTDQKVDRLKREFMTTKIVSLKLEDQILTPKERGIKVLKKKGTGLKLSVDTKYCGIGDLLNNIIAQTNIIDVNIKPPPLEDIISEIFNPTAAEEHKDRG